MSKDNEVGASSGLSRRGLIAGVAGAAAAVGVERTAHAAAGDPIYRIHPAIGVARLGNAPASTYFLGPEAPGFGPLGEAPGTTAPPYKVNGLIKPQAARFRLYEYAQVDGRLVPVREVNLDTPGVVDIRWTVHLANKKASFYGFEGGQGESQPPAPLRNASVTDRRSLEIDFGARSVTGRSQAPVTFAPGGSGNPATESCPRKTATGAPIVSYLGELRTDDKGRLIALGGKGVAGYAGDTPPEMPHWANNDGWFDDASDGPVTAVVTLSDGRQVGVDPAGGAWLLCGPPDFAPGVPGSVSGYDLALDLAVRHLPTPTNNGLYDDGGPLAKVRALKADYQAGSRNVFPTYRPSFTEDIRPMLLAAYHLWWVCGLVNHKHNGLVDPKMADPSPSNASARERVYSYMRAPVGIPSGQGGGTMPKLLGDDPYLGQMPDAVRKLTMTPTQFGLLGRWAAGAFEPGDPAPAQPVITPHGLDRAALENCVGGAFFPGIEFGWQLRHPSLWIEPFRLNLAATSAYAGEQGMPLAAGHFSRQMAVPWQADFNDCRNEGNYGWWPSQRPTDVLPTATATRRVPWARATNRFERRNAESTHEDMVNHWYKFGFVVEAGDVFVEKERAARIP